MIKDDFDGVIDHLRRLNSLNSLVELMSKGFLAKYATELQSMTSNELDTLLSQIPDRAPNSTLLVALNVLQTIQAMNKIVEQNADRTIYIDGAGDYKN